MKDMTYLAQNFNYLFRLSYKLILILSLTILCCNKTTYDSLKYLDKDIPHLKPKVFAEGIISTEEGAEFGSVFTENGEEIYFGVDLDGRAEIRHASIIDGKWTHPITIISHGEYSYNDPFLSPDESRLYYISNMPVSAKDTISDYDIWYSIKEKGKWSAPINAGTEINTDRNEFYISFTKSGAMYFASHRGKELKRKHDLDIYRSECLDSVYQTPINVGDAINTSGYEGDVFIAPDESYIIFSSARRSGLGKADLYISFKDENNYWTKAVIMGEPISSENHEICPFVTRDGKYFFYTSNQDIYWVSTELINSYHPNHNKSN